MSVTGSSFCTIDDFTIERIARFLCDSHNLHFLAHFARTCKRLNKICSRMINVYEEECEERFKIQGEDMFGQARTVWKNEYGEIHRWHNRPTIIYGGGVQWLKGGGLSTGNSGEFFWIGDEHTTIKEWTKHERIHRDRDKPAIVCSNGMRLWLKDGLLHREGDKPVVVYPDGSMVWREIGSSSRKSGRPIIISPDGTKIYKV